LLFTLQIPVTYPTTAPEIALPELDGKTAKMFRGGKICLSDHFKPLWGRNVPRFGIAHAMALGVRFWSGFRVFRSFLSFDSFGAMKMKTVHFSFHNPFSLFGDSELQCAFELRCSILGGVQSLHIVAL
jgi:hypothetical protein